MNGINRITVHHTGEIPGMDHLDDLALVKAVARHHRNNLGMADIGYHFLVGRDAKVYEGRPVAFQGAHARGSNNCHNLGIAAIGTFQSRLPETGQLAALRAVLHEQQARYNVCMAGVFGHRDLVNTVCPGDALYAWLRRYKAGALA